VAEVSALPEVLAMKCPRCGNSDVKLTSPDYGQGAEFVCLGCSVYGFRFIDDGLEAREVSNAARAVSRECARLCRLAELSKVRGAAMSEADILATLRRWYSPQEVVSVEPAGLDERFPELAAQFGAASCPMLVVRLAGGQTYSLPRELVEGLRDHYRATGGIP
jgi:hypothetical protein